MFTRNIRILSLIALMLILNAGVFFYAWYQDRQTAETACTASALVSKELQEVYRRNMSITYPQLYRDDLITVEGLDTLTKSAVAAIVRLQSVESDCLEAVNHD